MRLSHTKLTTILQCPMTYYLNYIAGIKPKKKAPALTLGSAVHWGLENATSDLEPYYKEEGSFKQSTEYTTEQVLAEAMVAGFLKKKESLFKEILRKDGHDLTLIEEYHEVPFVAPLRTFLPDHDDHEFEGIIDLLLLTDEGFIVIDYKTSSQIPNWDKYLDQIYRYIFLLKKTYPDVPIVKIGIINLRKAMIRQKKNENDLQFRQRLRLEYEIDDGEYINYHEYLPETLDQQLIDRYILNLSRMADMAQIIDDNKVWYINFAEAMGQYGKSQYYDIFYQTEGAEVLYDIKDYVWNSETEQFDKKRNCVSIDVILENDRVINKYERFKELFEGSRKSLDEFLIELKSQYITDDSLLEMYCETIEKEKEVTE